MLVKRTCTFFILLLFLLGKNAAFPAFALCAKMDLEQVMEQTSEETPEENKETKNFEVADEACIIHPIGNISPLILSKNVNTLSFPATIEIYIGLLNPPPDGRSFC